MAALTLFLLVCAAALALSFIAASADIDGFGSFIDVNSGLLSVKLDNVRLHRFTGSRVSGGAARFVEAKEKSLVRLVGRILLMSPPGDGVSSAFQCVPNAGLLLKQKKESVMAFGHRLRFYLVAVLLFFSLLLTETTQAASIAAQPTQGPAGTNVTVTGTGWPPEI